MDGNQLYFIINIGINVKWYRNIIVVTKLYLRRCRGYYYITIDVKLPNSSDSVHTHIHITLRSYSWNCRAVHHRKTVAGKNHACRASSKNRFKGVIREHLDQAVDAIESERDREQAGEKERETLDSLRNYRTVQTSWIHAGASKRPALFRKVDVTAWREPGGRRR